jgi:hypothetical protein
MFAIGNFEILNLFKQNCNFAVICQKYQKQNQNSTKYFLQLHKSQVLYH